ncbi:hypothetical protein BDZ89DRAFT_1148627 [Hymenopellis radicata]|nr:hypothetical protein BDZ89DRAFT_1148627 [Hymenopellis radicata]
MLDHPYADYTYDCTCTDSDVYAYVYPDDFVTCSGRPALRGRTRGGTLIHESSHFTIVGGTDDHVYGTVWRQESGQE